MSLLPTHPLTQCHKISSLFFLQASLNSESIQIIVLTLKKSRKIFSLTLFPIPDLRVVIVAAIIAAMEVMDSVPRKIIQHSETAAVLVKKGFFNNKSIKKN